MNNNFDNTKVAVGLFGIHYQESLQHWMGWVTHVDYTSVLENNREYIFNKFDSTFFSATYFSPKLFDLIKDFNFHTLKLKVVQNIKQEVLTEACKTRNSIFLDTIKLILDSNETFDYALLTRYDLFFKQSPLDNINREKINLICKAKCGNNDTLVDDNFYFMPYNKLQFFYDTLLTIPMAVSSHKYIQYFPENEFSYVVDGKYYSHEIPTYYIRRNK